MSIQDELHGSVIVGTGIDGQPRQDIFIGVLANSSGIADPTTLAPIAGLHTRENIMHDPTTGGSGTICFDGLRERLAFEWQSGRLKSKVTQFLTTVSASGQAIFEAYDSAGNQTTLTAFPGNAVRFNRVRVNTDPDNYSISNQSDLTVSTPGTYEVESRVTLNNFGEGNARTSSVIAIYRNGVEEPGSRSYGYHRMPGNGFNTLSVRIVLTDVQAGDTFTTMMLQVAGAGPIRTVAHGSSVSVRKLF